VHAAVLGALSLAQTPLNATVPPDAEERSSEGEWLAVPVEESRSAFPLLQRDHIWFDGIGPFAPDMPLHTEEDRPTSDAFGCLAGAHDGWERIELSNLALPDRDSASRLFRDAAFECAGNAAQTGWRGRGRVFVRVSRGEDGEAIATTAPLDDDARHDGLLCCLRQAQAPVVSRLRAGGAVRFVLVFGADPARRYIELEHTAASPRGGGREALAIVQRAFSE
jgi:hypothetical protein